jgi:hypothetical protein
LDGQITLADGADHCVRSVGEGRGEFALYQFANSNGTTTLHQLLLSLGFPGALFHRVRHCPLMLAGLGIVGFMTRRRKTN